MRAFVVILEAVVGLAFGLNACSAPVPDVYLFGDSNAAFVHSAVESLSDRNVVYNATPGWEIDNWLADMAEMPEGIPVVVVLGANDVLNDEAAWTDIAPALDVLGDRCVAWVTLAQRSFDALGEPYAGQAQMFNDQLWTQVEHVVTWDPTAPALQATDPVHYTGYGYDAYARVLTDALEVCT